MAAFDIQDIVARVEEHCHDVDTKEETSAYLSAMSLSRYVQKQQVESWLHWAKENKNLKIVAFPVPAGVLPKECPSGDLLDVKVSCRGPDDAIYDKYQKIRQRVARGNCFLNIEKGEDQGPQLILYGLKKFTGGLGDDDDKNRGDNYTWKRYFSKPMDAASRIIATRKANGEAAHLSCIKLHGCLLICAGSKNVHMLFCNREDIKRYHGDRFQIASEICHVIMDILESMESGEKENLLQFLACTGFTAIFEILSPNHQHVENLSHLKDNMLQFITWTAPDFGEAAESELSTVPPHIGIEIARALGLPTVDYKIIPVSDVDSHMKKIRQGYQFEGEVLYFLDGSGSVMGLLKKKTIWYIICRAIREQVRHASSAKLKNASTYSIGQSVTKMEKRLKAIQSWLGLEDDTLELWKTLGLGFLKWAMTGVDAGSVKPDIVGGKFPVLWKQYLQESDSDDKINHHFEEPTDNEADSVSLDASEEGAGVS